jgi:hypothetical protein
MSPEQYGRFLEQVEASKARRRLGNPRREMLGAARRSAKSRGIEFDLKEADLEWPTHCPALGIKLHYPMECAPNGGQLAGWELTEAAGLSEDESHGQAPHSQHRIQALGRPGLHCRGDTARSRQTPRRLAQPHPNLGKEA